MILTGEPLSSEKIQYLMTEVNGVRVFYPSGLLIKEGFSEIRVFARKFLFWTWLEIEGAKSIPVTN
jgi:hypothetical protein